jgi:hypothetical protein
MAGTHDHAIPLEQVFEQGARCLPPAQRRSASSPSTNTRRDEPPPPHSITSSAISNSGRGIARLISLAVLRLIMLHRVFVWVILATLGGKRRQAPSVLRLLKSMLCRRPTMVVHSLRAQQPGAPIDRHVSGGVTGLLRSAEHLVSMRRRVRVSAACRSGF